MFGGITMEKLTVNKLLEILKCEAECIQNYEDYCIAMDCIDQLKEVFTDNEKALNK